MNKCGSQDEKLPILNEISEGIKKQTNKNDSGISRPTKLFI